MNKLDISVLLVDDDKVLQMIYHKQISDFVREVYLAENGLEGLEIYEKYKPDLVITDIKMPMMNGLDMTTRLRRINPKARIILLSAYSESAYFLRAIDVGVKLFLLKPVEGKKLLKSIEEQAHEILLEKKIETEEKLRIAAEANLYRNEQILQAVSESAEKLLNSGYNKQSVNYLMARLGQAAQVSRVYLFENFKRNNQLYSKQTFEWVAEGISKQINNPDLQEVLMEEKAFVRWAETLSKGKTINGNICDFPEFEREVLESQEIISVLVVPVFVRNEWFGFFGFDDCLEERKWNQSEINTIITAANVLGASIQRTNTEQQLMKLNSKLELRVKQRTFKLENEIAERKIVENMLRESEEKYRLIFENANDGIFISFNNKILFINPRFFELTGYYPYQLTGKSFMMIVHPDYQTIVEDNYQKRLDGQNPPPYDILIIHASGTSKWVEIKSNLVLWDNQVVLLTFLTDIDERKNFEIELKFLNANLENRVNEELKHREHQQQLFLQKSKLESLGELAAGIAHEINQPLGGISMSIENVLDELQQNKLSEEYLKSKITLMFSDIERIRDIINQVRLFAREQESKQLLPFKIADAINTSLLLVNRLYIDHHIDFKINIFNTKIKTKGNPTQFEQVLLNILSNAKFAVDQKAKKIMGFQKQITLTCETANDQIFITITDNGIGIPESVINNVFNPFFTTKAADEGTGLGLSISYGIIRDMGGSIEIISEVNEYTQVKISLPLVNDF